MEYWAMDIWKLNDFNFWNEEVEESASRWSQNVVNLRSPSYLKKKVLEYCLWGINKLNIQIFIRTWC